MMQRDRFAAPAWRREYDDSKKVLVMESRFLRPVTQGMITARAQVSGQTGRTLQGQATVFDQDGNPVLDFTCTFKVAEDRVIRGIGWRSL